MLAEEETAAPFYIVFTSHDRGNNNQSMLVVRAGHYVAALFLDPIRVHREYRPHVLQVTGEVKGSLEARARLPRGILKELSPQKTVSSPTPTLLPLSASQKHSNRYIMVGPDKNLFPKEGNVPVAALSLRTQ